MKHCWICGQEKAITEFNKKRKECRACSKELKLYTKYKFKQGEYNDWVKKQDNRCALCGEMFEAEKRAHVDHDHKTGKVRGLLHRHCNILLGLANDDPNVLSGAIRYLNTHQTS